MELKELIEKRGALMSQLDELLSRAKQENRAFTEEDTKRFDALSAEVDGISGVTMTSNGLKEAVANALSKIVK